MQIVIEKMVCSFVKYKYQNRIDEFNMANSNLNFING